MCDLPVRFHCPMRFGHDKSCGLYYKNILIIMTIATSDTSGLYYKHVTIVNDASSGVNK
jgi:hypothetical protein